MFVYHLPNNNAASQPRLFIPAAVTAPTNCFLSALWSPLDANLMALMKKTTLESENDWLDDQQMSQKEPSKISDMTVLEVRTRTLMTFRA
jgi:hypothetical protein